MTFNPYYAELLGRELQKQRHREAQRERLIRKAGGWKPSLPMKLVLITRSKLQSIWPVALKKKGFVPLSRLPRNSTSL